MLWHEPGYRSCHVIHHFLRKISVLQFQCHTTCIAQYEMINFLIIKPTRCTNFSNLFLEWNSTCFGQFLCPLSGVFHCTNNNDIHVALLCVKWKTPDNGQRNCPKHVEFQFKNKFEKLVDLVGFIIRKFVTMHGHVNVKVTELFIELSL